MPEIDARIANFYKTRRQRGSDRKRFASERMDVGRVVCYGHERTAAERRFTVAHFRTRSNAPSHPPASEAASAVVDAAKEILVRVVEAKLTAWQSVMETKIAELIRDRQSVPATIEEVARRFGFDGDLASIVETTKELFRHEASAEPGKWPEDEPYIVINVDVGADADVDDMVRRQMEWHRMLIQNAPDAVGHVRLIVNYE